eukprot:g10917.t1
MTAASDTYSYTLCIPTAGKGTRMGGLCAKLNKALLPLPDGRGVISHIIDKFPREETKFVVALGYKGKQVKQYLEKQHPDVQFHFATVANFDGPGSGPGLSMQSCLKENGGPMERTESFYFCACDTLVADAIPLETKVDWMGVAKVPVEESARYCNFSTKCKDVGPGSGTTTSNANSARPQKWITRMFDKQPYREQHYDDELPTPNGDGARTTTSTSVEEDTSYIGLSYFHNAEAYWEGLDVSSSTKTQGELQMTNGIQYLAETLKLPVQAVEFEWTDVGGHGLYMDVVKDP